MSKNDNRSGWGRGRTYRVTSRFSEIALPLSYPTVGWEVLEISPEVLSVSYKTQILTRDLRPF